MLGTVYIDTVNIYCTSSCSFPSQRSRQSDVEARLVGLRDCRPCRRLDLRVLIIYYYLNFYLSRSAERLGTP